MKAYKGSSVQHHSFLSCAVGAELVSFMLWLLTPKSKCCQYLLNRRLGEPPVSL